MLFTLGTCLFCLQYDLSVYCLQYDLSVFCLQYDLSVYCLQYDLSVFCLQYDLMGKRELVALLNLSSWCLVMVERLFLAVPRGCLRVVIVVFPDHTHLIFLSVFCL